MTQTCIAVPNNVLAPMFQEAQQSTSVYRKNYAAMYKIMNASVVDNRKQANARSHEKSFQEEFLRQLGKIIACKKKGIGIERLIKFSVGYLKYCQEKGNR
jgi:hypothetical protein